MFRYGRDGDCLRVEVDGFDMDAAREAILEIGRRCAAEGLSRVLVDARGITEHVSIASRFSLAEHLAAAGPPGASIAIVVTPESASYTRTFENTANNRGAKVLTTDSMDAARAFLKP